MTYNVVRNIRTLAVTAVIGVGMVQPATAVPLLVNGGFELGLTGWTVTNLANGSGSWYVDTPGSTTPMSGISTSATGSSGNAYALSDQGGPGTHALTQTFTVAPGWTSLVLSFDMFVNNYGSAPFVNPGGLNHNLVPNQHARVDILTSGAGAFDTTAGVLGNFYLGVDAGINPHAFTHYSFDITSLIGGGGTFQLRFAETDNQGNLHQGVDNVSIEATNVQVPEPATLSLLILGLAAAGWQRRRKAGTPYS